jgi:hypothetical protein
MINNYNVPIIYDKQLVFVLCHGRRSTIKIKIEFEHNAIVPGNSVFILIKK